MAIVRVSTVAAMLTLTAAVSHAQPPETFTLPVPPPPPGSAAATRIFVGAAPAGEMQLDVMRPAAAGDLLFVEPLENGAPVTDAPYSAEAVTETTQTLADGNRISRKSSVQIARDGRGRERREHQAMMVGPMVARRAVALVTISDPVTQTAITLDHEHQVATRVRMRRWSAGSRVTAAGPVPPPFPPPPPGGGAPPMAFPPTEVAVPAAAATAQQWTMAFGSGAGAAGMTMAMPAMAAEGERQTTTLAPQMMEGVQVEGTRTTVTIAAGAIGNELPIEIVTERWYSPELKTVVLSRRADPRFGETVYRLVNIVRAEPGAELFEIPAGYRLDEPKLPPLPH